MTGKIGLLIGLMIGVVLAAGCAVISLVVAGSQVEQREARAYEAGLNDGTATARLNQGKVGDVLNKGMLEENADRARRADAARAKLKELLAIEGLPEPARAKAQEAMDALGQ